MIPNVEHAFKANFSAQDSGTLKEFAVLLFESAIIQWFQGAIVIFFGIALIISLVMENFFPDFAGDVTFSQRFQQVSLLVGFIYFIWVNRNMNGSVEPIKRYRGFLDKVKGIAVVLSSARAREETPRSSECQKKLLNFMIYLVDEMLRPGGSVLASEDLPLPEDYRKRVTILGENSDVFERFDLALHCLVENIPTGPSSTLVSTKMDALAQEADETKKSQEVREPIVFEVAVVLFLVFWWLVFTPASMWVQFGTIHTLWTYPLVMVVIAAPGIFRMWIGSPWNPMRPLRIAEHQRWPKAYIRFINVLFEDPEKSADAVLANFDGLSSVRPQ